MNPNKISIITISLVVALGLLVGCSPAAPTAQTTQPAAQPTEPSVEASEPASQPTQSDEKFELLIPLATEFVDQLSQGDYAAATSRFDATMKNALPEAKVKETWEQLLEQVGNYQSQLGTRTDEQQGYRRVFVTTQFENAVIDVMIVFDNQGQIAGLFFQPGQAPGATPQSYNPPDYVNSGSFHEVEVTVGSGEWALPGALTMPEGSGPFPAVVLVHGSGPNDRDETIGPNKPFRDLAWGLASQGIAVLRYDKRTKAHGMKFTPELLEKLTVQEETVDDALLAVQLLRETEDIDPQRIFVAGHSLGAYVAPRIGQQDPELAGLIIMAGFTRPLEDVTLDQFTYLYNLDETLSDKEKTGLETLQAQVDRVKDANLSDQTASTGLLLGVPPVYWLDLRGYQPAEVAKALSMPLFILQGGRDYQVSAEKDFPAWQTALEGKTNVTLKVYPELNHQLIAGEGPSSPEEYKVEGHVSGELVNDIAEWIKQIKP